MNCQEFTTYLQDFRDLNEQDLEWLKRPKNEFWYSDMRLSRQVVGSKLHALGEQLPYDVGRFQEIGEHRYHSGFDLKSWEIYYGRIYYSSADCSVRAVDLVSGKEIVWPREKLKLKMDKINHCIADADSIYIAGRPQNGYEGIQCYTLSTGELLWQAGGQKEIPGLVATGRSISWLLDPNSYTLLHVDKIRGEAEEWQLDGKSIPVEYFDYHYEYFVGMFYEQEGTKPVRYLCHQRRGLMNKIDIPMSVKHYSFSYDPVGSAKRGEKICALYCKGSKVFIVDPQNETTQEVRYDSIFRKKYRGEAFAFLLPLDKVLVIINDEEKSRSNLIVIDIETGKVLKETSHSGTVQNVAVDLKTGIVAMEVNDSLPSGRIIKKFRVFGDSLKSRLLNLNT